METKGKGTKDGNFAIYLAVKDPRVPWYAKFSALCVIAYVLSPIDLIPDFIPVLGYLDDLILVPIGIALTIKMIPAIIRMQSQDSGANRSRQALRLGWGRCCYRSVVGDYRGVFLYFKSK